MAIFNLVKDRMNDIVDSTFAYCNYSVNHLPLDFTIIRVNILMSLYVHYCNDYLLNKVSIRVYLCMFFHSVLRHLSKGLLVHLFLFSLYLLSFVLFFSAYTSLVFSYHNTTALATPALSLSWAEVVLPAVSVAALY